MDNIYEKIIAASVPLIIAALLKFASHIFNITGEKDKITKEKIDLAKSVLAIDNSLNISQYKILYEETFSLLFGKSIYFSEIKNIINLKSPKKAGKIYLKASPYIRPSQSGDGFEYSISNRMRFRNKTIPFPAYHIRLLLIYLIFEPLGLILFSYQTGKIIELINHGAASIFTYITNIGLLIMALTLIAMGIKALIRYFSTPTKSEIKDALGVVKDREYVIFKKQEKSQ